ncbi:hypothetical protein MKW98_006235 [Papaver atlanticum]|uniref:PGG domain-containing protein n=1 Tax=Papaver atlanticum TaxID=357466 RepID=A0AAD4TH43_9MAGN|nr:hypothetical protein MKW98_006235 [Papaver atlanticum]
MSTRYQLGDDESHEEKIDIKALLKMLVESQTKQAETQARQTEFQARQVELQQQIIEILKNTSIATDNHEKQDKNIGGDSAEKKENTDTAAIELEEDDQWLIDGRDGRLYKALRDNDMETVKKILNENPEVFKEGIPHGQLTALHLAIFLGRDIKIVEKIIELMPLEILESKTRHNGYTACHFAAIYGYPEAAKAMVKKHSKLTQIRDALGRAPLELAFEFVTTAQKKIVEYLYSKTRNENPSPFSGQDGVRLLHSAIDANFYDLASCLVKRFPKLVMEKSLKTDMCALELLVRKPFAFPSGVQLRWWQKRIYSKIQVDMNSVYVQPAEPSTCQSSECTISLEDNPPASSEAYKTEDTPSVSSTIKKGIFNRYSTLAPCVENIKNLKLMHEHASALLKDMSTEILRKKESEILTFFDNNPDIIKLTIRHGLIEVILQGLKKFGHLVRYRLPHQMMEIAIAERNEEIVNLLWERCDSRGARINLVSTTDKDGNTILHYASKLAPSDKLNSVSGVALQMQREVQWFKSIMRETDRFKRNKKGDTARNIFDEEHKDLLKKGEDWMKDTSGSCMIVAALVATVAFAAVFTVPGGYISESHSSLNGTPIFLGKTSFTMFMIADAVALFSSITSVLMFLAIYTSRYSANDFLTYLPRKVIIGFATLFISMAAILTAFSASLSIVAGGRFPGAPIPIAVFTSFPIILFAWLQLPLFYNMVRSTYCASILHDHKYIL